jgi:tetratricopeptide (TPR) repeat protein
LLRLVPDEPVSHYNLGVLHKLADKRDEAVREFEIAERLNPNLAAPHFQLYNLYRQAGRAADAARELAIFQKLKVLTEGAVIPEDMEWSYYAEIYDPIAPRPESEPAPPPKFEDRKLGGRLRSRHRGSAGAGCLRRPPRQPARLVVRRRAAL